MLSSFLAAGKRCDSLLSSRCLFIYLFICTLWSLCNHTCCLSLLLPGGSNWEIFFQRAFISPAIGSPSFTGLIKPFCPSWAWCGVFWTVWFTLGQFSANFFINLLQCLLKKHTVLERLMERSNKNGPYLQEKLKILMFLKWSFYFVRQSANTKHVLLHLKSFVSPFSLVRFVEVIKVLLKKRIFLLDSPNGLIF